MAQPDRSLTDRPCDRHVLSVRAFLVAVSRLARRAPDDPWELTPITPAVRGDGSGVATPMPDWDAFAPTAAYLRPPRDAATRPSADVDQRPPRFVISVKIAEEDRDYRETRIQSVAVRAYLAPPARQAEVLDRAGFLEGSGRGVRISHPGRSSLDGVFERLTTRERRRLPFVPPDQEVALAAVLSAQERPLVAFSPDGAWPRNPLVIEVARRLDCRILRRRLEEVPYQVRRQIRFVRFRDPAAMPAAGH